MFAVDPDSVPDSVKAACGDNRECLFDFAQTQDMDFAMSTMSEVEDQEDLRRILSEWPHCFFCCYNLHGLVLVYNWYTSNVFVNGLLNFSTLSL